MFLPLTILFGLIALQSSFAPPLSAGLLAYGKFAMIEISSSSWGSKSSNAATILPFTSALNRFYFSASSLSLELLTRLRESSQMAKFEVKLMLGFKTDIVGLPGYGNGPLLRWTKVSFFLFY